MDDINDGQDSKTPACLSRRSLLRRGIAGAAGMAALPAVDTDKASAAKFTQTAVFYRPNPSLGQNCSNCLLFEPPHACRSVAGIISPNGWCVIWRDG